MASPGSLPGGSDYNSVQCDMRRKGLSMKETSRSETELVAGNGLLHRRMFLSGSVAAMGAGAMVGEAGAAPGEDGPVDLGGQHGQGQLRRGRELRRPRPPGRSRGSP